MAFPNVIEQHRLINTNNGRSAEYRATIMEVAQGAYQVKFEWGSIGKGLQSKLEPAKPCGQGQARTICADKLSSKRAGGYVDTPQSSGQSRQGRAPAASPASTPQTAVVQQVAGAKAGARRRPVSVAGILGVKVPKRGTAADVASGNKAEPTAAAASRAKADIPAELAAVDGEVVYDDIQ